MALSEEVKAKLRRHIDTETATHAANGVVYPLTLASFETDAHDADIVAMAFMSQNEKRSKGSKK